MIKLNLISVFDEQKHSAQNDSIQAVTTKVLSSYLLDRHFRIPLISY